jgi:hypothetical protein
MIADEIAIDDEIERINAAARERSVMPFSFGVIETTQGKNARNEFYEHSIGCDRSS